MTVDGVSLVAMISAAATVAPVSTVAGPALAGVETAVLQTFGAIQVPTVARAVTALVGFFVAYQAFRGYRRNDSRPMLFLGVGIAFVTTVSFVVSTLVVRPLGASEAVAVLSWTLSNVVGLAAIFYAFTGASRGGDRGRRRSGSAAGDARSAAGEPSGEAGGGSVTDQSADAGGSTGGGPVTETSTDGGPATDQSADATGGGDR